MLVFRNLNQNAPHHIAPKKIKPKTADKKKARKADDAEDKPQKSSRTAKESTEKSGGTSAKDWFFSPHDKKRRRVEDKDEASSDVEQPNFSFSQDSFWDDEDAEVL